MTVVATEAFSGTAGTLLRGKTTTTGGLTWAASAAYQNTRDGTILNGTGGCSLGGGLVPVLLSVNAGSAAHYAQVRQTGVVNAGAVSDKVVCAAVAAVDYQNFIALAPYYANNQMRLLKYVAGTPTQVALITGLSLAAGDVYRLERVGSTVTAFQNGIAIGAAEGYTIDDSVFAGATSVGLYLGQAPQDGAFDDFEAGVLGGGGGGTLTLTTGPASHAVLQRSRTGGAKTVSLGGTYTGTAPADLQWSLETEAATPVPGYDWAMITGATIGGGTWSASVAVPPDTARAGYRVNVRSRDAGGATIATTTTNAFTVGVLVEAAGQSNMQGQFVGSATAPGLSGKCAWWDGQQWVRASNAGFTAAIKAMSDLLSLPVGFATTAVSATGARSHAPAHTSTDGAVAAGQYWSSFTTLLAAWGGDLEAVIWYQGEGNVGGDMQQYKDAVNARIAGVKAATGRTGAGELSYGLVVIGKYTSKADADVHGLRNALVEVASSTPGAFVAADAVTYEMADAVHLAAAEYTQLAYCEGRSMAVARGASTYDGRGPRVTGASITGSTVTVAFDLNGATGLTGASGLTGWEWYDGSAWVVATDVVAAGAQVTFTAAGAQQMRYLYGATPITTGVTRGNVKAAPGAANPLPVEPTRQAVAVTGGMPTTYVRPLIWDGQRIRRMGPSDVIDPAIKALFT